MPLVKIDLTKETRSPKEIRKIADVVQDVMLQHFNAPPKDRYQMITQHEPYEIICEDTNLGLPRTQDLIFIQIFQQGRTTQQKQAAYEALHEQLYKECGLLGSDLIISCVENTKADWSFGMGEAQFLTGKLPQPQTV